MYWEATGILNLGSDKMTYLPVKWRKKRKFPRLGTRSMWYDCEPLLKSKLQAWGCCWERSCPSGFPPVHGHTVICWFPVCSPRLHFPTPGTCLITKLKMARSRVHVTLLSWCPEVAHMTFIFSQRLWMGLYQADQSKEGSGLSLTFCWHSLLKILGNS